MAQGSTGAEAEAPRQAGGWRPLTHTPASAPHSAYTETWLPGMCW